MPYHRQVLANAAAVLKGRLHTAFRVLITERDDLTHVFDWEWMQFPATLGKSRRTRADC